MHTPSTLNCGIVLCRLISHFSMSFYCGLWKLILSSTVGVRVISAIYTVHSEMKKTFHQSVALVNSEELTNISILTYCKLFSKFVNTFGQKNFCVQWILCLLFSSWKTESLNNSGVFILLCTTEHCYHYLTDDTCLLSDSEKWLSIAWTVMEGGIQQKVC